jgi:hypothetical protein
MSDDSKYRVSRRFSALIGALLQTDDTWPSFADDISKLRFSATLTCGDHVAGRQRRDQGDTP